MPVCWVRGLVGLVAVSETADEAGPTGLVTPSRPSPQASRGVWLLLIFLAPGLWSTVHLSLEIQPPKKPLCISPESEPDL